VDLLQLESLRVRIMSNGANFDMHAAIPSQVQNPSCATRYSPAVSSNAVWLINLAWGWVPCKHHHRNTEAAQTISPTSGLPTQQVLEQENRCLKCELEIVRLL
jgi:hypothetical protein